MKSIFVLMVLISANLGAKERSLISGIDKVMGEGKMDFERLELSYLKDESSDHEIHSKLISSMSQIFIFVQENYNLITLSIETNYKTVYEPSKRRIEYIEFVREELQSFFSRYIGRVNEEEELQKIVKIIGAYEYLFQIHDSVKDLFIVKEGMDKNYTELRSDLILIIRELSSHTLGFFDQLVKLEKGETEEKDVKKEALDLQKDLDEFHKDILKIMSKPDRTDAAVLLQILTYTQRLKDKLVNYNKSLKLLKE